MIEEQIEFRNREVFTRHGGAYDRGSADAYYHRPACPHYFTGATYDSTEIEEVDMSEEEIAAYMAGYNETTDRKDWS
jgi:CBS-domain-containing membrane protein